MFILLAAALLNPFFLETSSEVRTSYNSLGKMMEDRPMMVNGARLGYDSGTFGRFGARHWDVSSLTDRRSDAHEHGFYHTEVGMTWEYDIKFNDKWKLHNDLTRSWTFYRRFKNSSSNRDYHWYQLEQALENPYLVPYCRMRRTFRGNDYYFVRLGVRHKFPILTDYYLTPAVLVEGGNGRALKRMYGPNVNGGDWAAGGFRTVAFRLEGGWKICDYMSVFIFVEQYETLDRDARDSIKQGSNRCAHADWTVGGTGVKLRF